MENEVKYAGFWIRQVAGFIDSVAFIFLYYAVSFVITDNAVLSSSVYFALTAVYYIVLEASPMQGCLGKKVFGLKVVTKDGKKMGIIRSVIRNIWFYLPMLPVIILAVAPKYVEMAEKFKVETGKIGNNPEAYSQYITAHEYVAELFVVSVIATVFTMVLSLLWFLPIAFTSQKTGLHDIFTRTRVVYKS